MARPKSRPSPQVQDIPQSRPDLTVVDEILDAFKQHSIRNALVEATEAHIPRSMERRLDDYYKRQCGKTAREMVPKWGGIRRIVWDAEEFKVC